MIKLNDKQKQYLLFTFFEDDYNLCKCFGTCNKLYLISCDIELDTNYKWACVYLDGELITQINSQVYSKQYKKLLRLK